MDYNGLCLVKTNENKNKVYKRSEIRQRMLLTNSENRFDMEGKGFLDRRSSEYLAVNCSLIPNSDTTAYMIQYGAEPYVDKAQDEASQPFKAVICPGKVDDGPRLSPATPQSPPFSRSNSCCGIG